MTPSLWIRRPRPNADARLRLFCVPHAGAGPSFYARWLTAVSPAVEVCLVHLPGRESRFDEKPVADIAAIAEQVAEAAEPLLDLPAALFGHSMGATIAYELAHRFAVPPLHLFASGSMPPHQPGTEPHIAGLPDAGFLAEVRSGYGGLPDALWDDRDLMRLLLPVLRADFAACETYRRPAHPPLTCAVTALAGAGDHYVPESALAAWGELTTGEHSAHIIGEGHFNVADDRAAVHQLIREQLGLVPVSTACRPAVEGARHG